MIYLSQNSKSRGLNFSDAERCSVTTAIARAAPHPSVSFLATMQASLSPSRHAARLVLSQEPPPNLRGWRLSFLMILLKKGRVSGEEHRQRVARAGARATGIRLSALRKENHCALEVPHPVHSVTPSLCRRPGLRAPAARPRPAPSQSCT